MVETIKEKKNILLSTWWISGPSGLTQEWEQRVPEYNRVKPRRRVQSTSINRKAPSKPLTKTRSPKAPSS